MKSKKGFTLVELLAVIAILAILVIIALPNILNLYRNARKNVFVEEAQNVLRTAQQKYLEDSLTATTSTPCYSTLESGTPLDIDAKSSLKYAVQFGADGNVSAVHVSDDNYSIKITTGPVKIESLTSSGVQTKGNSAEKYTAVSACPPVADE